MPKGVRGFQKGHATLPEWGFQKGNRTKTQFKKGHKFSPETIAKISESNKGKTLSAEHKARTSATMKGQKRRPHTDEEKEKVRQIQLQIWDKRGRKHDASIERIKDSNYILWRAKVFARDDYNCQECGQHGHVLNAHHIKDWLSYPESRYDVDNGVTLCKKCHMKTPSYKRTRENNGRYSQMALQESQ